MSSWQRLKSALIATILLFTATLAHADCERAAGAPDLKITLYEEGNIPWLISRLKGIQAPPIIEVELVEVTTYLPTPLPPVRVPDWLKGMYRAGRAPVYYAIGAIIRARPARVVEVPDLSFLIPGQRYTYVIHADRMAISPTGPTKLENHLSKHFMLTRGMPYYAGEMWLDPVTERIYMNNASGSFAPSEERLQYVEALMNYNLRAPVVAVPR